MLEGLGIVGIAISVIAYLPQIAHLGKKHCSAGISRRAWTMWLVSSLLVGALAIDRGDPVFILLQASTHGVRGRHSIFGHRYRGMVCEFHSLSVRPFRPGKPRARHDTSAARR